MRIERHVGRGLCVWLAVTWTLCVLAAGCGSKTTEPCASGTYSTTNNAASCAPWSDCVAGQYATSAGSATSDRVCAGCASGSYSTTDNAASCTPWSDCAAGQYVTGDGTATSDRSCAACVAGAYSPATNAVSCVAWTVCAPGEYVSTTGSATSDRACTACASGEYSDTTDAVSCTAWTVCGVGFVEGTPGTSTTDRTCVLGWTRQFGTTGDDFGYSVSVDGIGNVFVAGYTGGALPGQTSAGLDDAFVRKYDSTGTELWTRQFGTPGLDYGTSVSVDGSGNVFVSGNTDGALPGQTNAGSVDAFVRKYDSAGTELWTRQFGSTGTDVGTSVSVDGSGNVFVAGNTWGALPGQTSAGGADAFVRKYDSAGTELWTQQFGSSTDDIGWSVSVDGSGNVFMAGYTWGTLPGQTSAVGLDAFVRKYDSVGTELWTRQFGSTGSDYGASVSVDGSGNVFVAGYTTGALPGQTNAGVSDAFVRKYDSVGTELWTRQFGSTASDYGKSVSVDGSGNGFVAGYTWGALPGQTSASGSDAFVMRLAP